MKSLEEMGVSFKDVVAAIWKVRNGNFSKNHAASHSTYILCPERDELWDLKPVVSWVLDVADPAIEPKDWQTPTYLPSLRRLGFSYVKFTENHGRNLGINGDDPTELLERHCVYWPDGRQEENGFAPQQRAYILPSGEKVFRIASRYVRNGTYKKGVLSSANGLCDACGGNSFLASNGERFLEVHHKTWLSEGGPDIPENMVALCPNCHRQEHFGVNRQYPWRQWN